MDECKPLVDGIGSRRRIRRRCRRDARRHRLMPRTFGGPGDSLVPPYARGGDSPPLMPRKFGGRGVSLVHPYTGESIPLYQMRA